MSAGIGGIKTRLDAMAARGVRLNMWWRDDDAVTPGAALDRLIGLGAVHRVPCLLAVIPAGATAALAERLREEPLVHVAQHGWNHENHAGAGEKKQELGAHRPLSEVLGQLAEGRARLAHLFGDRVVAILVPPWNRIALDVAAGLPALGFDALSVFGTETPDPSTPARLARLNAHVDLIDWHATRGGRDDGALVRDLTAAMDAGVRNVGLLTHHLVHDATAWSFMNRLFAMTAHHPGCVWRHATTILAERVQT